jgi:hypothetical protein
MTISYAELTNPETMLDLSQVELVLKAHEMEYSVDYADPFGYGEKHVFNDEGELIFTPDQLGRFHSLDVMDWIEERIEEIKKNEIHKGKVRAARGK